MQVAGMPCGYCGEKLITAEEGTWCADCGTKYHRTCLKERNEVCRTCGRRYEKPEERFIYAKYCPKCGAPTDGHAEFCRLCNTTTFWDTEQQYREYKADHTRWRWWNLCASVALVFLAAACLVLSATFGGFMDLGTAAAPVSAGTCFWRYWQVRHFE
jgi:hypothetical protein